MPRLLRRILVVAGLVAWGLVVAEVSVRVMDPQPLIPRYITGTPWGVRGNIPGAVYRHRTPEVDVQYRINHQGMRADREFPLAPPADACRIAIVGDSFFVGYETDLADTIASRLEVELAARGLKSEVLNFAVSGFGTAEMLRTWEGRMRAFSPDMVVMQWHITDLDDNVRSGLYVVRDGQLQRGADTYLPSVELQDRLMRSRLYRAVADNSQLYSFVRETVALSVKALLVTVQQARDGLHRPAKAAAGAVASPAHAAPPAAAPGAAPGAVLSGLLLRESMREVRASGAEFIIVDIPESKSREDLKSVWDRLPREYAADLPVYHAGDALRPLLAPATQLYFEKGQWHLTPLAVRAVTAGLADRVEPLLRAGRCAVRLGEQAVGPQAAK